MFEKWFLSDWSTLLAVVASTLLMYFLVILYTRLVGLRSFAKLSGFEFASTLATGSILASTAVSESVTLPMGAAAVGVLYLTDLTIGNLRRNAGFGVFDNEPLLLVIDQTIIGPAMERANMTEDDLRAKLREANVLDPSTVRGVIMETTGDVSVLHGDEAIHDDLLRDVIDLRPKTTGSVETTYVAMRKLD